MHLRESEKLGGPAPPSPAPEPTVCLLGQPFDVTPFRDVGPHTQHSSARAFQFRFCLGEIRFFDAGEDYFPPLTDTPFGYPRPMPLAAPGMTATLPLNSFSASSRENYNLRSFCVLSPIFV